MSVWTQSNCVVTTKGNEALTEISAKGGTMSLDSIWTCSKRVSVAELHTLTDLPVKNQKMTLVKYSRVSSGYTINVQVTNEDLNTPYSIEMVGVYMKLNGFNEGNPFLYMVLLSDEGSADQMTNISKSTYKYAIYLYHTNAANIEISLNPTDYVATDTYEAGIKQIKDEMRSLIYQAKYSGEVDDDNYVRLYTENFETNPFVVPNAEALTQAPIIIIHNYSGYLPQSGNTAPDGWYIDDVGPFYVEPFNQSAIAVNSHNHEFEDDYLVCVFIDDENLRVINYFDDTTYIVKDQRLFTSFNNLPYKEGVYSLTGTASNSPITIPADYKWSASIVKSSNVLIVVALNNYDNNIYRRSVNADSNWDEASSWVSIGGGGGIQTATVTIVDSSNNDTTEGNYLRIMRDDTTNSLKLGDVLMCTLTELSTLKTGAMCSVRYLDSNTVVSKTLYNVALNTTPLCQIPKYFLIQYDGTNFHMLTPLNITTHLAQYNPDETQGKYGDVWYTY